MSTQILAPTVIPSSPVISPYVYSAAFAYSLDMVVAATIVNNGTPNIPCRALIQLTADGLNWQTMSDARKANGGYNATTTASFSLDAYTRLGTWTQFRVGFGAGQGAGATVSAYADGVAFGGGGGGSGTVNPGSTNQLAAYPAAGPSVSGISLAGTLAISGGNLGVATHSIGPSQLAVGTAETLLGFDGSGNPGAIAAGANVTISGGTIAAGGGGSGTVNAGTANQLAGYPSSGTSVGGLTLAGGNVAISGGNLQINTVTVATYVALYAIPLALRTPLMVVGVQADNSYWAWNGGTTLTSTDWTQAGPLQILLNGSVVSNRGALNLITGSGVTLTVADNSGADRCDITIAATGGPSGPNSRINGGGTQAFASSAAYTTAWSVTAGNTLIVYGTSNVASSNYTFSDSSSNSYTTDGATPSGGFGAIIGRAIATVTGALTITLAATGAVVTSIYVEEYQTVFPLTPGTPNTPTVSPTTNPAAGNLTLGGNSLVVALLNASGIGDTFTASPGYTLGAAVPYGTTVAGIFTQYILNTTTSPQNPKFIGTAVGTVNIIAVAYG